MKSIKFSEYIQIVNPKYKYLKVVPNTSIRNYKSDEIAAYVNTMYKNLRQRIIRDERKLIVKSNCKLSYYIHITRDDVQFFFIVPEYHISMIKQRINNVWNNKITIEEVSEIPNFRNNASKVQVSYKNFDSLSLGYDKKNNDLLSSEFTVINSMLECDSVGIIYNFMPSSNREMKVWHTHFEEDMNKYKQNKPLEKITKDPIQIFWITLLGAVNGLDKLIKDIQVALGRKAEDVVILKELSYAIVDKKQLSNATLKKKNDTIINTQIVAFAQSNNIIQQNKLIDSISNSFDVIREDNQLVSKPINKNFNINDYDFNVDTIRCSDKEISNFIALPGRSILNEYKHITKTETNENNIPIELQQGYISLGQNQYKNTSQLAYFNNDKSLRNLPIAILGASRSGKSTYSINLCKNIVDAGESLIVIDFIKNTELSESIKSITPPHRLIDLDLSIPENLQAFAYNEVVINDSLSGMKIIKVANLQIKQLMALVDSINLDNKPLTGKMRRYLLSAGMIVFVNQKATCKDVIKCLQNHKYRLNYINSLDTELKELLEEHITNLEELNEYTKTTKDNPITEVCGTKDSKIEGILDRINLLKETINLDLMFNKNPKDNINFVDAMNEGKVILIRMREDEFYDSLSKNVLTTFFISKIWLASQLRGKNTNNKLCTVLIDEVFQTPMAQQLIGKQLVQSAKFGLKYVLTLHYLNQLSNDTQEALKSANSSYMLISGCDKKAFIQLEYEFNSKDYGLDDLLNLKEYHSLNLVKTKKSYAAFITKLPPEL